MRGDKKAESRTESAKYRKAEQEQQLRGKKVKRKMKGGSSSEAAEGKRGGGRER